MGKTKKSKENLIIHEAKESVRLNKYISDSGFTSRREADKLIEQGIVTVNGLKANLGVRIYEGDIVKVKEHLIIPKQKKVYIMLHKPTGITTTTDLKDQTNIINYLNYPEKIFPIGRLDKDSSGLILLTNDGDIVNKILREEYGHEKEYVVTVDKDITDDFIKKMANGVLIYNLVTNKNQMTQKCEVTKLDRRTFKIILKQGLNRQIRRMTNALNYQVKSLKRVRIINIKLKDLKVGEWRHLNDSELIELNKQIN